MEVMRSPVGLHESEKDIENERAIVQAVATAWQSEVRFLPTAYHIDAMLLRDGRCCFVEVRKRNNERNKYKTLALSLQKYVSLTAHSRYAPTFYVVQWTDGIFWTKVEDAPLPIGYMSRQTGDPRDNEPVVHIPTAKFQALRGVQ